MQLDIYLPSGYRSAWVPDPGECLSANTVRHAVAMACPESADFLDRCYLSINGRHETTWSAVDQEYQHLRVEIRGRLPGGKGGFGSLLKGQKGGKKKTTNFDSCRDLYGRRVRHARAVERLAVWMDNQKEKEAAEKEEEQIAKTLNPEPPPIHMVTMLDDAFIDQVTGARQRMVRTVKVSMSQRDKLDSPPAEPVDAAKRLSAFVEQDYGF
ncbi:MAG: hypothetical protein KVP17_003636 [Porospora cf. gigantea B]|uniref:uncharacterized protein n=1 Tax=Porospora cf. gigantea B TaxID=2853592 RepID=UPI003571CDFE|nr:MAG: hypothetical protein KVP17_003636 [Porospora cf. gigantea B]